MGWAWDNLRIGLGVLAGSWLWIAVVTLLSLALSAWVKWRPVAGALLFGIFLAAAGFGAAVNEILYTKWGYLLDLSSLLETIWRWLFQVEGSQRDIPVWSAFASLLTACGLCLLLLRRKVRAYEVVRS
jgi:ABC-2 type transport system permease protein